MNGAQKFQIHRDDRSTDRLPAAHTCFNQLDLPAYEVSHAISAAALGSVSVPKCSVKFGTGYSLNN